jgi:large subunit ribosomal protein L35
MPKLKTKRGAAKRLKVTAGGIKFNRSGHNHILTKKSSKRKAHLCKMGLVHDRDEKNMARLLLQPRPSLAKKYKSTKIVETATAGGGSNA